MQKCKPKFTLLLLADMVEEWEEINDTTVGPS